MWAVLSLPLACLLAQAWLVPGSTLASHSPEAQAGLETLLTPTAQNKTSQTSERQWAPEEEEEREEDSPWLLAEGQQLSREASNLGFSLLRKISLKHDGNVVFSPLGLAARMGLGQSWLSSAAWRTEAASGPSETHTQNAAYSRCEMTDKCSQSFKGCQSQYKVAVNVVNS